MSRPESQLKERNCCICGKTFIFRDNWAYKQTDGYRTKVYCSWTCLRRAEKGEKHERKTSTEDGE